jgi:hypothetical protein
VGSNLNWAIEFPPCVISNAVALIHDGEWSVGKSGIIDKRISKVVQAPGFIRGINPKSQIENPQAPAFIRGVNLKSKI